MTELSFLIELLLNHDLPKDTKTLIAERIKFVESNLQPKVYPQYPQIPLHSSAQLSTPPQALSTLAAMARHGDIPKEAVPPPQVDVPPPVEVIAQTPQTAQAMLHRQESIAAALSGKVDKTTGRPRKW